MLHPTNQTQRPQDSQPYREAKGRVTVHVCNQCQNTCLTHYTSLATICNICHLNAIEVLVQELTSRQQEVLDFVCRFREEHGCPPSLREISKYIGTKGTATAKLHLEALERKGYISRRREGSRGIALKHAGGTPIPVPLVGIVRAGQPELAVEDIQGYVSVDPAWLKGEGNFLLRVRGDSMIEAGIFDGDLALIHPQPTAENGQIVVALIDGEATLKRFFADGMCIRLQPENKHMLPIVLRAGEAEAMVVGRLLKTIRSFD